MQHRKWISFPLAICLVLLVSLFAPRDFGLPFLQLAFAAPDSLGNDINYVEIYQWNTSDWEYVYNFTSSGGSARIHDSWQTRFNVSIKYNSTLASSTAQAISYTKVLMNITKISTSTLIWTNVELNNTSCVLNGSYYYLVEQGDWNSTLAEAGESYNCTSDYQPYY